MKTRVDLHNVLVDIIGDPNRVYFQPKNNLQLTYPCIVYSLSTPSTKHANNSIYTRHNRYSVTYMTKVFNEELENRMLNDIPYCSMDRPRTVVDNIYHTYFTIFV